MPQCDERYSSYIKRYSWSPVVGWTHSTMKAVEQSLCLFPGDFEQNLNSLKKGRILTAIDIRLFVKLQSS